MPRSRYTFKDDRYAYFITSTVLEWLPIFTSAKYCQILTDAFVHLRTTKGLHIYGWVILDNHCHAIVAGDNLSQLVASWRSYTAKKILRELHDDQLAWALSRLAFVRSLERKQSESVRYQLWQDGTHPQLLDGDLMFEQKLDYIHHNPVKRGLVQVAEHWRWSSAHEYLKGSRPVFRSNSWHQPGLDDLHAL